MSHPLSENIHLHLQLYLLGLCQENSSQGMRYHLCRESLPWLLPKTQMPTMTDAPLQGERAPALDRDLEPFLETPCPGEWLALQPPSLPASCGCHQLTLHPGQLKCPSPELICIWCVCSILVTFYFFRLYVFFPVKFLLVNFTLIDAIWAY